MPIQFVEGLTTVWYSHIYSFVMLQSYTYPEDRDSPQVLLRVYIAQVSERESARERERARESARATTNTIPPLQWHAIIVT